MENKIINTFWQMLEPRFWWIRHIVFWCYTYSNYILETFGFLKGYLPPTKMELFCDVGLDLIIVYFFFWFLIPNFLEHKRYKAFLIGAGLSIAAYIGIVYIFFDGYFLEEGEVIALPIRLFQHFFLPYEVLVPALGLRFLVEYLYNFEKQQMQQNEQLKTELAYLKNQINPHFLFNTLNNIAALSEIYPERVTPVIVELSNVLRYQLYESEKESVFLVDEIENLKQNLNLEALRLNKADVDIKIEGSANGKKVAPLLFLPFLENALKHSANPSGVSRIDILFKIEDNSLTFTVKNSKPPAKPNQLAGGLGLKNIQRRLELLYSNKHNLQIEDKTETYSVVLKLEI
jgi:Histidine kinase